MTKKAAPRITTRATDALTDRERLMLRMLGNNAVIWIRETAAERGDMVAMFYLQRFGLAEPSIGARPQGETWDGISKLGFKITDRGRRVLTKMPA